MAARASVWADDWRCRPQAFDMLPNLIDVLKDVLAASSSQETTRVGDVSSSVRSERSASLWLSI